MPLSEIDSVCVMLFRTVSCVMLAESILKERELPHKIIPVPREISSDCGVCLSCDPAYRAPIEEAIANRVTIEEVRILERRGDGRDQRASAR